MVIFFSAATALMLDLPPMTLKMKLVDMAKEVKSLGIFGPFHPKFDMLQVNLFQKPSFLHQLTHKMTRDCLLNSSKNTSSQHVHKNCSFVFVLTFKTIFVHGML